MNDRLELWLRLINAETEEELDMLYNTKDPEIQKAVDYLRQMSADEKIQEMAREREMALQKERQEAIARMRKKGYTEEQIHDFFGDMDE